MKQSFRDMEASEYISIDDSITVEEESMDISDLVREMKDSNAADDNSDEDDSNENFYFSLNFGKDQHINY